MAKGLIGASLMSGFGQGVAQAAGTGLQIYGSMMLQQQRERMEDLRYQRMEAAAAARDARQFAQQKEMQADSQAFQLGRDQEARGQRVLEREQDRQAHLQDLESQRDYQRGGTQEERGQHIVEREQDRQYNAEQKGLDRTEHRQDRDEAMKFNRAKLESDERQSTAALEENKAHHRAIEAQHRSKEHDMSDQDKLYAQKLQKDMEKLGDVIRDPMTDEKARTEARRELASVNAEYMGVIGRTPARPTQTASIVNPFSSSPLAKSGVTPPPAPPTRPNQSEEYRTAKKAEADQRREETRRGAMQAMEAQTQPSPVTPPTPPPSTPPQTTRRMDYQRPSGMQQPGDASPATPPLPETRPQPPIVANVPRELPRTAPLLPEVEASAPQQSPSGTMVDFVNDLMRQVKPVSRPALPTDVFLSPEYDALPGGKQSQLARVFNQYEDGKIDRNVLNSSVHAILDDVWGAIKAEDIANSFSAKKGKNPHSLMATSSKKDPA